MTHIILSHDEKLTVKLQLNLQPYCVAYQNLRSARMRLNNFSNPLETQTLYHRECLTPKTTLPTSYELFTEYRNLALGLDPTDTPQDVGEEDMGAFSSYQQLYDQAEKTFKELRKGYLSELTGFTGALHWFNIKAMMASQNTQANEQEKRLAPYLKEGSIELIGNPLVIECLNQYFIELLKNSIDAVLKKHLDNNTADPILEMKIRLELTGNDIAVTITDNGSGFPEDYLAKFTTYSAFSGYKSSLISTKQEEYPKYYFGGAGIGMRQLLNYILDGEELKPSKSKKIFCINPGETSFQIQNHRDGGAQIILRSPLLPFKKYEQNQSAPDDFQIKKIDTLNEKTIEQYECLCMKRYSNSWDMTNHLKMKQSETGHGFFRKTQRVIPNVFIEDTDDDEIVTNDKTTKKVCS